MNLIFLMKLQAFDPYQIEWHLIHTFQNLLFQLLLLKPWYTDNIILYYQYTMVLILITIMLIILKMYLSTNFITMLMIPT